MNNFFFDDDPGTPALSPSWQDEYLANMIAPSGIVPGAPPSEVKRSPILLNLPL